MKKNEREEEGLREAWRKGRPAGMERVRAPNSSVLSIRVSDDLLQQLTDAARREDKPVGTYARELIERVVVSHAERTPRNLARIFSQWADELDWVEPDIGLAITYASEALLRNCWVVASGSSSEVRWGIAATDLAYGGRFHPSVSSSGQTKTPQTEPAKIS
jgi:hypothetical protein